MKTRTIVLSVFLAASVFSCSDDGKETNTSQGEDSLEIVADIFVDSEASCSENSVVIDEQAYNTAETDLYDVVSAKIDVNCLVLTVRHNGGCEEATLTLYDKGSILESSPSKRLLRLAVTELDDCEKLVQRTEYFDLDPIKIPDDNRLYLIIDGLQEEILFEY